MWRPSTRQGAQRLGTHTNTHTHARAHTLARHTSAHTGARAHPARTRAGTPSTHTRALSVLQEELALLNSARPSVGFTFMRSMSARLKACRVSWRGASTLGDVRGSPGRRCGRSVPAQMWADRSLRFDRAGRSTRVNPKSPLSTPRVPAAPARPLIRIAWLARARQVRLQQDAAAPPARPRRQGRRREGCARAFHRSERLLLRRSFRRTAACVRG